jgi:hypothetical protein
MKFKLIAGLWISLLFLNLNAQSPPITTHVTQHYMGAWAYSQHINIVLLIQDQLNKGELKLFKSDGTQYSESEIRSEFLLRYENDKYLYSKKDTNFIYKFGDLGGLYSTIGNQLAISNDFIQFGFNENYLNFYISRVVFDKYLSREKLNYLEQYNNDGFIYIDSIPKTSSLLFNKMTRALYNQSFSNNINVYNTPFLVKNDTINKRSEGYGGIQFVVFRRTDPKDPTIGVDSEYLQKMPYDTSILKRHISISFIISNSTIELSALSSFYIARPYKKSSYLIKESIGFIKFNEINFLTGKQLEILNDLLPIKIDEIMRDPSSSWLWQYNSRYNNYLRDFQVQVDEMD